MCFPSQIVGNCYAKILYINDHSLLSIGRFDLIDPFPSSLYCIWLIGISCIISLPNSLDDLYPPALKFHSVLCTFDFAIANAVVSKEPCLWVDVCWDINNVQREQQWPGTVPWGTPVKTGAQSDFIPFTTTLCCLKQRKESIYFSVFPQIPWSYSLHLSCSWGCIKRFLDVQDKSVNLAALWKWIGTRSIPRMIRESLNLYLFSR